MERDGNVIFECIILWGWLCCMTHSSHLQKPTELEPGDTWNLTRGVGENNLLYRETIKNVEAGRGGR